ncbi:macrolide transport system ATP-binding/permease protein [Arthrobacter pigmenti]|uniref:Macrolide transport system ATP-binding/permease protein n=1 Tax=Arthrobacter pigmenti TaxID=271432 RepID=A0A846RT72_9MICC|nr:ABC-F family ATP-binding cassette domain-containing protein [Arthrobacter pigmenti]NJC23377.1 macrolide transport system ATP-binding/permease protein [Arthrobacter pigmenti]
MTEHLFLSGVSHGYGDKLLLNNVDLLISSGERVALVGENGAGKSTILRLASGRESPDAGVVKINGSVGYLAQTLDHPPSDTVGHVIDAALSFIRGIEGELRALEAGLDTADDAGLTRYGDLQTQFALHGGYEVDARVGSAMQHLGLGGIDRGRTLSSLSGGEQERLALACLLADPAAILLLDEPTNHLDDDAVSWLERQLASHRGAVLAVSHDRAFLRTFATSIVELDADRLELRRYGNGYEGYLAAKESERRRWEQEYQQWLDAQETERLKAVTVEQRMGYGRKRDGDKMAFDFKQGTVQEALSSQKRNALERLRRLQENPVDRPPQPLALSARFGGRSLHGDVVTVSGLVVSDRLAVSSLRVAAGEKLLVTGPNGAGKTTLLNAIAGTSDHAGTARHRGRLGYLPQELAPPEKPSQRLLPAFAEGLRGDIDEHADRLLNLGLFRSRDFTVPVGGLSAGQYRRLALARLLVSSYDVLLFDEPTNHLSPVLVGELEEALERFAGTLLVVSHDRELRRWFAGLDGSELRLDAGRVVERRAA